MMFFAKVTLMFFAKATLLHPLMGTPQPPREKGAVPMPPMIHCEFIQLIAVPCKDSYLVKIPFYSLFHF